MKSLLCLLLLVGSLPAATTFTGTGVSADINVSDQHTLAVTLSGTFVATVVLEQAVSGGYVPLQVWNTTVTYKPPRLTGIWRLRCSDYTSGTVTYTLASIADNQVIYRKPNGSTAFSVDVDGLVTSAGGAISGGSIDNAPIGATTPAAGTFTTVTATDTTAASMTSPGGYTSTVATGTAPFTATSTTACPNLNASALLGSTWTAPGTIGSGTPSTGAFTTLSASSTSTLAAFNASGASTVTNTLAVGSSGTTLLTLTTPTNGNARALQFKDTAGTKFNWQVGAQINVNDGFEITPSTAGGGTTFSNPAIQIDASTGAVTLPNAGSTGLTIAKSSGAALVVSSTTDATTAATGAETIAGGLGVTKNIVGKQGLGVGVTSVTTAAGTTALTTASTACQVFTGSTTQTLTLPAASAFGAGTAYVVYVKNVSTGTVTVQRAGSDTINSTASNVTSFTLAQWASCTLYSDGVSAWERF